MDNDELKQYIDKIKELREKLKIIKDKNSDSRNVSTTN
jgi:hypothetical protein